MKLFMIYFETDDLDGPGLYIVALSMDEAVKAGRRIGGNTVRQVRIIDADLHYTAEALKQAGIRGSLISC